MSTVKFREHAQIAVERDANGITVWFRETDRQGGETVTRRVLDPITLRWAQMSDATRAEGFGYGMEVRLTRAAAIEKDSKTGKSASVEEKHAAVKRLADHYASGTDQWAMASLGGGGLSADTKVLIEALVRVLGLTPDTAEEQVRAMTSDERAALRLDPEIKPAIDQIYREQSAKVDTKGLLAKLRGGA